MHVSRFLLAVSLASSAIAGCHYYQDYRVKKTGADVNEQKANNMRAHRDCLQRNERRPDAEAICRPYADAAR